MALSSWPLVTSAMNVAAQCCFNARAFANQMDKISKQPHVGHPVRQSDVKPVRHLNLRGYAVVERCRLEALFDLPLPRCDVVAVKEEKHQQKRKCYQVHEESDQVN